MGQLAVPTSELLEVEAEATPAGRDVEESADGYLIDVATEKVLGLVGQDLEGRGPDPFTIRDADGADWVLDKMAQVDAEKLALEARKREVVANFDRMIARLDERRRWLSFRFDAELAAQALRDLVGSKKKSVIYPHGKVAFITRPGPVEITDMKAAVEFVLGWVYDAVKQTVGVTGLKEAIAASCEHNGGEVPDVSAFATFHGPSERVHITTGIGKETEKP